MLAHVLELVDMVHLQVLQEEKQDGRNRLHDDLFVTVDVQRDLGGLDDVGGGFGREDVHQDVERVVPGSGGGGGRQEHLQQCDHVLREVGQEGLVDLLRGGVPLGQCHLAGRPSQ